MKKTIKTDDLVTAMADLEGVCREAEHKSYVARVHENPEVKGHWVRFCDGIRESSARLEELLK